MAKITNDSVYPVITTTTPETMALILDGGEVKKIKRKDSDKRLVTKVDTLAELKALTGLADGQSVEVTTTGRAGLFRWTSADTSTEVALDEVTVSEGDGGVYVAPDSDKTGASGAFVRTGQIRKLYINWYGAEGDDDGLGNGTDNLVAINATAKAYRNFAKFLNPNGAGATTNPHYAEDMCIGATQGLYYCSGSVNFSTNDGDYNDGIKNIKFDAGAIIVSGATGKPAVDLSGNFGGDYTFTVFGITSAVPKVGILCARTGTAGINPSAGAHRFTNVFVLGSYSIAAVYQYASEINQWTNCFLNNKVGICTLYETANNQTNTLASDYCTIATTYQSSYGSTYTGTKILWSGNDEAGALGLVVIEAMSFGPKFNQCYGDMQQGATNKRPYFLFNSGGETGTSANIQAPSIIDCQFENDFDSLVELNTRVNELRIQGCTLPTAADTADIVISSTGKLYAPDIQKFRGGTTVAQMEWDVHASAILEKEQLAFYSLDNVSGNYVTESSLTLDGTFYELDVSSDLGIPTNVKFVDVRVETRLTGTPGGANFFKLRGDGEAVSAKEAIFQPQVDGVSLYQEAKVPIYGGKIEYSGAASLTRARILIRGYDL